MAQSDRAKIGSKIAIYHKSWVNDDSKLDSWTRIFVGSLTAEMYGAHGPKVMVAAQRWPMTPDTRLTGARLTGGGAEAQA